MGVGKSTERLYIWLKMFSQIKHKPAKRAIKLLSFSTLVSKIFDTFFMILTEHVSCQNNFNQK
jgi:hypothetical protein